MDNFKPTYNSFIRYLEAKKTVDDRALNAQVWSQLAGQIPPGTVDKPLKILEIGAGVGTMVQRALERRLFRNAHYTAVDAETVNISHGFKSLPAWAREAGFEVETSGDGQLLLKNIDQQIALKLVLADIYQFLPAKPPHGKWDLLIAHAFLDLVNLERALPLLLNEVRPGGLVYFTINFDGVSIFEPVPEPAFEAHLLRLYHQTMDDRMIEGKVSGDSQTGRHLFEVLSRHQVEILAAGSSDWVVYPGPGGYPGDEAYFLHFIIHTIETALTGHPDLDETSLQEWAVQRHGQVEQKVLKFIAHQLDFLGRVHS
jgi:SAM-dependent methyltransferase